MDSLRTHVTFVLEVKKQKETIKIKQSKCRLCYSTLNKSKHILNVEFRSKTLQKKYFIMFENNKFAFLRY